jgi:hypothetical protein
MPRTLGVVWGLPVFTCSSLLDSILIKYGRQWRLHEGKIQANRLGIGLRRNGGNSLSTSPMLGSLRFAFSLFLFLLFWASRGAWIGVIERS